MAHHEHLKRPLQNATEKTPDGVDKLTRYGWTVIDEPGDLMMVPKWKLHVDQDYQRDANANKILDIASAWSWLAFGGLIVARRDGKLWVVDGQHRLLAAMKRSDIKELPCIVFKTRDQREEAAGFLGANTGRKPVTAIAKFHAAVVAGDETAVCTKQILDERGIMVGIESDHPRVIRCIHLAQRLAAVDRDSFVEVIDFIVRLCGNAMGINERLLGGIEYLHRHCGTGLRDRRLADRLIEMGAGRLLEGAARAAAYYAKGGSKIWAQGFLDVVNKGLRDRFELEVA